MPWRRIIIPSGCAECASPRHSAHPIARSAHLEMRTLLTFGCGRGPRASSDPVGSLSYYHQLMKETITQCPSVASLYRVDEPKAPVLRIKRIHLACRRISSRIMEIFCFLCYGGHLGLVRHQEFSLPPTHEFNLAITRCAGDAPTNQVEAPKAQDRRFWRIHSV
jgi:hypothetical protein